MHAIVVTRFSGVADGAVYPRWFHPGDKITGALAQAEVASGRAVRDPAAPENAMMEVPETKSPFPTGPAKSSSSRPPVQARTPTTSKRQGAKRSS